MKRSFGIIAAVPALVLSSALALSACSGGGQAEETGNEETEAITAEEYTDDAGNAEADDSYDEEMEQVSADADLIAALDPTEPEDIGTVHELNYKGLEFEALIEKEVTDEYVDEYISTNLLPYMPVEDNDSPVEEGCTVNIDYVGRIDGETFDGGTGEGQELVIGSDSFIDGFEDGLIGASCGDTVVLDLKFADDYWLEDVAGKDVEFTVTINNIYRTVTIDELDDEKVKSMSGYEDMTLEAFKQEFKDSLTLTERITAKSSLYNNAIAAALDASDVETNDDAINWQLDAAMVSIDSNLQTQGWTLAYYCYMIGNTYEEYRASLWDQAEEACKELVLRKAICEAEGLTYSEEALQEYLEEIGYTQEQLDSIAGEEEQKTAVQWYQAGKAIVDNGTVTYVEEITEEAE